MKQQETDKLAGHEQEDLLWQAVQNRDGNWDGKFFFGVMTTGVYCRPSCAARKPLRKNVRFFLEADDAERAGLRPCLRCHPRATLGMDPETERINKVCDYARSHSEDPLPLSALAAQAGLSPFHFQRTFKAVTGLTPKQFVDSCRMNALKTALRTRASVTDAIYEAGFGSPSRLYERVDTRLGMTPAQYREGGKGVVVSYVSVDTQLGRMMIGATDRGLCFVQFADRDEVLFEMLRAEYPAARLEAMREPYPAEFERWMTALQTHLEGGQQHLDLRLDLRATAFQRRVWEYLQTIPYGSVQSYSEVASAIGQPSAARAVARACAANRVALAIPCHRVIRGSGELGGYRWGLDRKRVLIDGERRAVAKGR